RRLGGRGQRGGAGGGAVPSAGGRERLLRGGRRRGGGGGMPCAGCRGPLCDFASGDDAGEAAAGPCWLARAGNHAPGRFGLRAA
ncbi:unnamed protein product, partial [Effrenium voratum]